jgi:hypothetical protein
MSSMLPRPPLSAKPLGAGIATYVLGRPGGPVQAAGRRAQTRHQVFGRIVVWARPVAQPPGAEPALHWRWRHIVLLRRWRLVFLLCGRRRLPCLLSLALVGRHLGPCGRLPIAAIPILLHVLVPLRRWMSRDAGGLDVAPDRVVAGEFAQAPRANAEILSCHWGALVQDLAVLAVPAAGE